MKTTWELGADEYVHLPGIVLTPAHAKNRNFQKWGKDKLVPIPISNRYNGGFVFTDKHGNEQWARGFKVGKPVIPDGYELISIHCGANLMAQPNTVDMIFRKKKLTTSKQ
ncbi:MAG: hypothetical protein ACO29Q_04725 [Crocinitomicaceae bacterium]